MHSTAWTSTDFAPPPRTISTAVFVTSVAVYSGILPGYWIFFHTAFIFKLVPELWRIPTSFLLTLPKLSILLDPYFRVFSPGSRRREREKNGC